jgi:predicted O-methyltransferase YrrM
MNQKMWSEVDKYFCDLLLPSDPVLDAALADSDAAGLPQHNVAPNQGKLLQLLVQMAGARSILEIGTLGGYSTIWLARALPAGGRLVTLEANPKHAAVAWRISPVPDSMPWWICASDQPSIFCRRCMLKALRRLI